MRSLPLLLGCAWIFSCGWLELYAATPNCRYDGVCTVEMSRLPVPHPQLTNITCWAASLRTIFAYYHHDLSEEAIVTHFYPSPHTGDPWAMEDALNMTWTDSRGRSFNITSKITDNFSSENPAEVSNTDIVDAISKNKPIFYADDHHAMVVTAVTYKIWPTYTQIFDALAIDPYLGPTYGYRHLHPDELEGMFAAIPEIEDADDPTTPAHDRSSSNLGTTRGRDTEYVTLPTFESELRHIADGARNEWKINSMRDSRGNLVTITQLGIDISKRDNCSIVKRKEDNSYCFVELDEFAKKDGKAALREYDSVKERVADALMGWRCVEKSQDIKKKEPVAIFRAYTCSANDGRYVELKAEFHNDGQSHPYEIHLYVNAAPTPDK